MNRATLTSAVHNTNNNMRRSSIGVPVSALIFPRSESIKLTKEMEEKYGFLQILFVRIYLWKWIIRHILLKQTSIQHVMRVFSHGFYGF